MRSRTWLPLFILAVLVTGCADKPPRSEQPPPKDEEPPVARTSGAPPTAALTRDQVKRLSPQQVQTQVQAGAKLVCAYDSDAKFAKLALQGAISRSAFGKVQASTAKTTLLIFYCAWSNESSAASLAAQMHNEHGFKNVAVLQGGPQAWTAAGLPLAKSP